MGGRLFVDSLDAVYGLSRKDCRVDKNGRGTAGYETSAKDHNLGERDRS